MNRKTEKFEEDEEVSVALPPDTQAILQEFLRNQSLQKTLECQHNVFEEDWQLSQFWYNESTKKNLSHICLKLVRKQEEKNPSDPIKIALMSSPSLYKPIKNLVIGSNVIIRLFEFDMRFSAFGEEFVYYDYKDVNQNEEYKNYFDIIIADPPFLSKECILNTSNIINKLKKDTSDIIMCSGQTTAEWIRSALNLHQCEFRPEHERNLANEFCSFANFDLDSLLI